MASPKSAAPPGRARLVALLRPLPLLVAMGVLGAAPGVALRLPPGGRSRALVHELAGARLETTESDVRWLDPPRGPLALRRNGARALVLARSPGEAWDVYLVRTRLSPEGTLLGVDGVFDVTRTSAVSESALVVSGLHAGWTIGDGGRTYRVELADVGGDVPPTGEDWTSLARAQHALTNLQRTGQLRGLARRSFKLDPAAHHVALTAEGERLVVVADDHRIVIPWDRERPVEGQRFVREEERVLARPGNLVTWAVDRARDLSWFGDERMQLTKAIAYAALDRIDRALGTVRTPSPVEPLSEGLGESATGAAHTDPDTGWPPAPLTPPVQPALPDEGTWFLLDHDPFVRTSAAVPNPLVTTYLRADGARPDSRVYVVAWDPRQVELDVVAGTEEPQSATGETGTGMIPRRPEVLSRVVAAFNGAFQSTHGDFGMMADGAVLVPPKPYAATIARLENGDTGFGTWPHDLTITKEFVSFRQNLTPLVADGKLNPYGREWWGGVPHDWEDETHTVRSGLCLTKEGFIEYFYGTKIDHVHLGRAMIAARCDYGVHLDMNQGHTGLELYRVDEAKSLPPISDKLDGHWQTEGDVLGMPGWRFRGRRLVRNLQLMHFPRYIRRGARDYFYLMLRPLLPRAALTTLAGEPGEGQWAVRGLPQYGFPYALATTSVRPDGARPETKVRVLAVDPTVLRPAAAASEMAPTVLSVGPPRETSGGDTALWIGGGRASVGHDPPTSGAVLVGRGSSTPRAPTAAAACIDRDGKVVYAEVATAADPSKDASLLTRVLEDARCDARLFFATPLPFALGGSRDLSDHPVHVREDASRLVRAAPPGGRRIFEQTPVVSPEQWMPLQRQTRWFPKEPEPALSASAAPEPESAAER